MRGNRFALLLLLALIPVASLAQAPSIPAFQDDLLDHLQGQWTATDKMGSKPAVFSLQAEWMLNHQFFHISQRQQNVEATKAFGADFYIGYDPVQKKYVAHALTTFGGADSPIGLGERTGNGLTIKFPHPPGDIVYHFNWQPESTTWRISAADNGRMFIDLTGVRSPDPPAQK